MYTANYQITDHLGSARVVFESRKNVLARNDYYAFGKKHLNADLLNATGDINRWHFNGKEWQTTAAVGFLDYGARMYDGETGRWFGMDFLSEKYYPHSPYNFTLNNPVKYIDPNGMDVWELDYWGNIINRIEDTTQDAFYIVAKDAGGNYQRTFTTDADGNKTYDSISFEYGTVESQRSISFSSDGKTIDTYDVYQVRGDDKSTALFNFMSEHITGGPENVEVSQAKTGVAGNRGLNFITTSHEKNIESGMSYLLAGQLYYGYTIRELNHSHPNGINPSRSDRRFASDVTNTLFGEGLRIPNFNIWHVPSRTLIPFGK